MEKWGIKEVKFAEGVYESIEAFLEVHPKYKRILEDRINDLLNFPDLIWQAAELEGQDEGHFTTKNQQLNLAGKAYKAKGLVVITYFSFHP